MEKERDTSPDTFSGTGAAHSRIMDPHKQRKARDMTDDVVQWKNTAKERSAPSLRDVVRLRRSIVRAKRDVEVPQSRHCLRDYS